MALEGLVFPECHLILECRGNRDHLSISENYFMEIRPMNLKGTFTNRKIEVFNLKLGAICGATRNFIFKNIKF